MSMERESMEYDVLIVGAGPAGLACAIHLKQLAQSLQKELSVCLIDKGAAVGEHLLSGAVLEPSSLKTLLPDTWQDAPLDTPVSKDLFYYLTHKKAYKLPTPKPMKNEGNFIISLNQLAIWLGEQAETLGVEIYTGFAATDLLYDNKGRVIGVATGEFGIDKQGEKTSNYQASMNLIAKHTLFAEGCRGQLSQRLIKRFNLAENRQPQSYGIGIKELWRVDESKHQRGLAIHSIGWPLDKTTYGGSFIYHLSDHRVAIGFVIGLDYKNPWLSPFDEMQQFKTHPLVSELLTGGERLAYGARAINEGGLQCLPKLSFSGGALIGDCAGFLNVPKIKGIHAAIHSGMLAAKATLEQLEQDEITNYLQAFKQSTLFQELKAVRNIRPAFHWGLLPGLAYAALETYLFKGREPWTFKYRGDHLGLIHQAKASKIHYPKPDNVLTFDKASSLYLSGTFHEENQPCHLKLSNPKVAIDTNYELYASPEQRYCPAGVYEIIQSDAGPSLQINAQNCLHCKTCDIKDPTQAIQWHAPEGSGGPSYSNM